MNHFIKRWMIPNGYIQILKSCININNSDLNPTDIYKEKLIIENESFRNKYKDVKRCFILATGPSIKNDNLKLLENEFCISVSNFFVHENYSSIQPKFHIFAPTHPPITTEQFSNWIKDAEAHNHSETTFVVADSDRTIVESTLLNSEKLFYLSNGNFPVDFCKKIPPINTVVQIAIYLAMYFGIKDIYLLGVDHSHILHYGISKHFYDESKHKLVQDNYNEWFNEDIGHQFQCYVDLWDCYREIRTYSEKNNYRIINLSKESLLDIFEKDTLENTLKI